MFTKIFAFAYRNWIFAKRNFFAFTEIVFWPFVSLVAIGLMGNFLDLKGNVANFVLTGAITGGVLQVTQLDVSYSLLYDIWSKSLKHTFLAPVTPYHYVIGSWLIGMIRGSVVFLLLAIFSYLAFGFTLPSDRHDAHFCERDLSQRARHRHDGLFSRLAVRTAGRGHRMVFGHARNAGLRHLLPGELPAKVGHVHIERDPFDILS